MIMGYPKDRLKYFIVMSFEISRELHAKVSDYANEHDMSKSHVVRLAVNEYLKNHADSK